MNTKFTDNNAIKLAMMILGNTANGKARIGRTYYVNGDNSEKIAFTISVQSWNGGKSRYFVNADHTTFNGYGDNMISNKTYLNICHFFNRVNELLVNFLF